MRHDLAPASRLYAEPRLRCLRIYALECPACDGPLSEEQQATGRGRHRASVLFCVEARCGWREWTPAPDHGLDLIDRARDLRAAGLTGEEIAGLLGVSRRTVNRLFARGRGLAA